MSDESKKKNKTKNRRKYFKLSHVSIVLWCTRSVVNGHTQPFTARTTHSLRFFRWKSVANWHSFHSIQSICRHYHVLVRWKMVHICSNHHLARHHCLPVSVGIAATLPSLCLSMRFKIFCHFCNKLVLVGFHSMPCHARLCAISTLANIEIKLREKWFSDAVYHAHDILQAGIHSM